MREAEAAFVCGKDLPGVLILGSLCLRSVEDFQWLFGKFIKDFKFMPDLNLYLVFCPLKSPSCGEWESLVFLWRRKAKGWQLLPDKKDN